MTVLYILAAWTVLSIPCGIAFCWLLKTKRMSFEVAEDDSNEFVHDWLEGRI